MVIGKGKKTGKQKDLIWIKTDDNTDLYDLNTEIESWEYEGALGTKKTKEKMRKQKVRFEDDEINDSSMMQLEEGDEINDTFITLIPESEHEREDIKETKQVELKCWDRYDAYEEVDVVACTFYY